MDLEGPDAIAILENADVLSTPSEDFLDLVCGIVRELVPCDVVAFSRILIGEGRTEYAARPPDWAARLDSLRPVIERLAHQHPLVEYHLSTGRPGPFRTSDVVDQVAWTNTELYRDYYSPLGLRHQVLLAVPSPDDVVNVLALSRSVEDFSDRDVAVIRAIRPHITLGCRSSPSTAPNQTTAITGGWVVVRVDGDGVVLALSEPDPTGTFAPGTPLPDGLEAATGAATGASSPVGKAVPFVSGDEQWLVRSVQAGDGPRVLMVHPMTTDDPALLSLTDRQREVLFAVADGCSNQEVAARLGISGPTVKKHLQRIFETLGVSNRVAAAARIRPRAA